MPQYNSVLLQSILGKDKLKAPPAPHVDVATETNAAIDINAASLPKLEDFASKFNDFSSGELLKQLNKMLPGYSDNLAKEGADIASELKGELPQDVQDLIGRKAAELGISTGTGGSSFSKFGQLRDLGMTSLQVMQHGFDATSRWIASAVKPQLFDFSSMLVTPMQMVANQWKNEESRWSRDWLQAQLDDKPEGWLAGLDKVLNYAETTAASYGTMSMGGGMGGGGGMSKMMGGGGGGGGGGYSAGGVSDSAASAAGDRLMSGNDMNSPDASYLDDINGGMYDPYQPNYGSNPTFG